jgi:hypothetical protein
LPGNEERGMTVKEEKLHNVSQVFHSNDFLSL